MAGNECPGSGPATTATRIASPCHSGSLGCDHDRADSRKHPYRRGLPACAAGRGPRHRRRRVGRRPGVPERRFAHHPWPSQDDEAVQFAGRCQRVRGEDPPDRRRRRRGAHRTHRRADLRTAAAAVLGLRRVRGPRRTDHVVARLLRFLRHVQGNPARPGGSGGAGTADVVLTPMSDSGARPNAFQFIRYCCGGQLPDSMRDWVRNDLAGKGATGRMMRRVAVPAVLVLAPFWLIPTTLDVHLSMTLPILIPFVYFSHALNKVWRRHMLQVHGLDPNLVDARRSKRDEQMRRSYIERYGPRDESTSHGQDI